MLNIELVYRYIIVALLAMVVFLTYRFALPQEHIMQDISKELLIGLIAGLVIAFLLENASRQELKKTISTQITDQLRAIQDYASVIQKHSSTIEKEAFRRAFRKNIPRTVLDTVEKKILVPRFLEPTVVGCGSSSCN